MSTPVVRRSGSFDSSFLGARSVLVTGHTGFKGGWLTEWLLQAGANVHGIALPPEAPNSLFELLAHSGRIRHAIMDIRDADGLATAVRRAAPDLVIHMAAQALVRRSYRAPLDTWSTNVTGTLNLLEALRGAARPATVIVVTTDKVYRNREWSYAYREVDELGGHDPYSASKAACELAVASWRASYPDCGITVATARAGNVLGGGDWSEDRIVPDCYRAWMAGSAAIIRNPHSTRPWQHVLEPLSGYLQLAHRLMTEPSRALESCNFGPGAGGDRSVAQLVSGLAGDRPWLDASEAGAVHEARSLSLAIERAEHELGWTPQLSFAETLAWVDAGYSCSSAALRDVVMRQIDDYRTRRIGAGGY